ncbi:36722_t:CDS:1, partial [Racocetra persica]
YPNNNIIDQTLEKLDNSIQLTAKSITFATASLRSCYFENASSVRKFKNLRNSATISAKIYCTKVMPFYRLVIQNIQEILKNYKYLSLEDIKKDLDNLVKDAGLSIQVCKFTLELHKYILTDFKKTHDEAFKVEKKLQLAAENFIEKKEKLTLKQKITIGLAIA